MTASVPGESNQDVAPDVLVPRDVVLPLGDARGNEARPSGNAAFPRNTRLVRHADFERVYKLGRRHFSASMTVFYWPRTEADNAVRKKFAAKPSAPGLRIGFTVSRALGGAVQRNRMKRRLREAVRLTRPQAGASADVVINPKKSLLTVDFTAVVNEVSRAFVVIEEKLAKREQPEKREKLQRNESASGSRKPEA